MYMYVCGAFSKRFQRVLDSLFSFLYDIMIQPRSQGLSSLAPEGGKMRDPGNEVDHDFRLLITIVTFSYKLLSLR